MLTAVHNIRYLIIIDYLPVDNKIEGEIGGPVDDKIGQRRQVQPSGPILDGGFSPPQ